MKKYNAPTCDITNVATDDFMATAMSIRIFDKDLSLDNSEYIITDGCEILSNRSKLWDEEIEEEEWK
jgi:hypothetical protein